MCVTQYVAHKTWFRWNEYHIVFATIARCFIFSDDFCFISTVFQLFFFSSPSASALSLFIHKQSKYRHFLDWHRICVRLQMLELRPPQPYKSHVYTEWLKVLVHLLLKSIQAIDCYLYAMNFQSNDIDVNISSAQAHTITNRHINRSYDIFFPLHIQVFSLCRVYFFFIRFLMIFAHHSHFSFASIFIDRFASYFFCFYFSIWIQLGFFSTICCFSYFFFSFFI